MTNELLLQKLKRPEGIIDAVLDTDAYNEIDDQYAIVYFLFSPEKIRPQAIYAAPFSNTRASTPEEGMEKSYDEILNIINLCGKEDMKSSIFKGSKSYLVDENIPQESAAANDLVKRAMTRSEDNPLYVLTIGAITNIASALLIEPRIKNRIVVVWLGGQCHNWPEPWQEFNMRQDIAAARVVFGSGVPLIQLPCMGVVSHLVTTEPELREHIKAVSPLGEYLYEYSCKTAIEEGGNLAWSRVIWDISVVAWLLGEDFVSDKLVHAVVPSYDNGYIFDSSRHFMKVAFFVNRDLIFADLFGKIKKVGRL